MPVHGVWVFPLRTIPLYTIIEGQLESPTPKKFVSVLD